MKPVLSVNNLACGRGGIPLIEGVSFDLSPGKAMFLRGPNGIGKTTLLRCLVGLQRPLAGTVAPGADTFAYGAHADAIKPTLTVDENLNFWCRVFGANSTDRAIAAFDLDGLRDRLAGELSAGQRRRLGLARLILTNRPIWALDEPTVALDTANVARFADAVRDHLTDGGMAIIATHIDMGIDAISLDLEPFKAVAPEDSGDFDEAFL